MTALVGRDGAGRRSPACRRPAATGAALLRERQPYGRLGLAGRHRSPQPARVRRRLGVLLALCMVLAVIVASRLVVVQGLSATDYAARGDRQLVRKLTLPAERGSIFDRTGQDLALTVKTPSVFADPSLVEDPRQQADALAPVLAMDAAELRERLSAPGRFVHLARHVGQTTAEQVKELGLAGVGVETEPQRFLPGGDLAVSLVGRVGVDDKGLTGLEYQYDRTLTGTPGRRVVERDRLGQEIPGGLREFDPASRGDDLVLTIDGSIQYETERRLGDEIRTADAAGGMALVMDAKSGELLAVACLRTDSAGNPRSPGPTGSSAEVDAGTTGSPGDAVQPCTKNETVTNVYEPGSVQKLLTIAAALDQGVVGAKDNLVVPDHLQVADHVFRDHDPHPTSRWSVTDIVANSSNIGTIQIARELGKQRLYDYQRAFGFGSRTGLGDPGESPGILLDPSDYSGTSIGSIPIGQGIAVTAVQMLAAYNTVANGGVYVAPKLVAAVVDSDGAPHPTPVSATRRVVSESTATEMTAMLGEVVRVGTGTAGAVAGYRVAGKTGTARKPDPNGAGYLEGAYVSSFAGFVPLEEPSLTAMVILDQPTPIFGGVVAAPVFAQIARYALRQLRIPPLPADTRLDATAAPATAATAKGVGDAGDSGVPTTPAPRTAAADPPRSTSPRKPSGQRARGSPTTTKVAAPGRAASRPTSTSKAPPRRSSTTTSP